MNPPNDRIEREKSVCIISVVIKLLVNVRKAVLFDRQALPDTAIYTAESSLLLCKNSKKTSCIGPVAALLLLSLLVSNGLFEKTKLRTHFSVFALNLFRYYTCY